MIQRLREWCWRRVAHRHLFRVIRHIWPNPDASVYVCVLCGERESWEGYNLEITGETNG